MAPWKGHPNRIAIATVGSRGDFQPVLALALGLRKAGYVVKLFAPENSCLAARDFGFEAEPCGCDVQKYINSKRGKNSLEKGIFRLLALDEDFDDDPGVDEIPNYYDSFAAGMLEFNPALLLYSPLVTNLVVVFLEEHPDLPRMYIGFQPQCLASESWKPIPLADIETDVGTPTIFYWSAIAQTAGRHAFKVAEEWKQQGKELPPSRSIHACFDEVFAREAIPEPLLLPVSPSWWTLPADVPTENIHMVGCWNMSKEDQQQGSVGFFSDTQQESCVAFLAAGKPPVYIGWGSMVVYSSEYMTRLAVGALREAGERGVVLGGWAGLGVEHLDEALQEYCSKNVLFLKVAAHEWLFPQCACAVHHGGIGTTMASLRAGLPTVITPVFADQEDIAEKLSRDKHGVGTARLPHVTVAGLAQAIRTCCTDETIKNNVKQLAPKMRQEDGVANTLPIIRAFLDDVSSGKWKKSIDEYEERLRPKVERMKKMRVEGILASWSHVLTKKYPQFKEFYLKQMEVGQLCNALLSNNKLWCVRAASALVRSGESTKSPETGRFKKLNFLEELEMRGSRLHVKRVRGVGPEEGWITPSASGKDLVTRVKDAQDLATIQSEALAQTWQPFPTRENSYLASIGVCGAIPSRWRKDTLFKTKAPNKP